MTRRRPSRRIAKVSRMNHPVETLRALLDFNPETGIFHWKNRDRDMFSGSSAARVHLAWNARYSGKAALISVCSNGYLQGGLLGKKVLAHRVAVAITTGAWPVEVDHINGDKTDNRLLNLRTANRSLNVRNLPMRANNTSGVVGVYFCKRINRWCSTIEHKGKRKYLGSYSSKSGAITARRQAEVEWGFHGNHGRRLAHK